MINVEYEMNPDGTYRGVSTAGYMYGQPQKKGSSALKTVLMSLGIVAAVCVIVASAIVSASYIKGLFDSNKSSRDSRQADNGFQIRQSDVVTATPAPTQEPTQVGRTDSISDAAVTADKVLTVEEIAAQCADCVVMVNTEYKVTSVWSQSYVTSGAGSGVIISQDGYIITNNHVIDKANTITVTLTSGDTFEAELVATDPVADVAVIRINPGTTTLSVARIGKSADVKLGETCVAIGNPMGLGVTVTDGIISALSRSITIENVPMTLMQTNAEINPGNSGGALFNKYGYLIGIVNAKASSTDIEGIGFAIPIDYAVEIANQLISNGYVAGRADWDVTLVDINDYFTAIQYMVSRYGVYVYSAQDGSEVKPGDCILTFDGQPVQSSAEIEAILLKHQAGDTVEIEVYRNRQTINISITLTEAHKQS